MTAPSEQWVQAHTKAYAIPDAMLAHLQAAFDAGMKAERQRVQAHWVVGFRTAQGQAYICESCGESIEAWVDHWCYAALHRPDAPPLGAP